MSIQELIETGSWDYDDMHAESAERLHIPGTHSDHGQVRQVFAFETARVEGGEELASKVVAEADWDYDAAEVGSEYLYTPGTHPEYGAVEQVFRLLRVEAVPRQDDDDVIARDNTILTGV